MMPPPEFPKLKIADNTIPEAYDLDKSEYQYHLAEVGRSTSFVLKKSSNEKFVPASTLGQGGYGCVRLFISEQDSSHKFAVKNFLQDQSFNTQADIDGRVRASIIEVDYLARVHPGLHPYLLRNFINNTGNFDNRMLMPYFPGKKLIDFSITYISTAAEFALLMLKVAQEVMRIHKLGLYHGDVRDGNFIIDYADVKEFGIRSFTVRMIDFDHGGVIGKRRTDGIIGDISWEEFMMNDLDENTDVAELRTWMMYCQNDLYLTIPDAEGDLDKYFPALRRFIYPRAPAHGVEDVSRPVRDLQDFINHMTANLQDWEWSNNLKNRVQKSTNTHFNLFAEKPLAMNDDDDIAKEYERNSFVL